MKNATATSHGKRRFDASEGGDETADPVGSGLMMFVDIEAARAYQGYFSGRPIQLAVAASNREAGIDGRFLWKNPVHG
jgi:hypothetical protein